MAGWDRVQISSLLSCTCIPLVLPGSYAAYIGNNVAAPIPWAIWSILQTWHAEIERAVCFTYWIIPIYFHECAPILRHSRSLFNHFRPLSSLGFHFFDCKSCWLFNRLCTQCFITLQHSKAAFTGVPRPPASSSAPFHPSAFLDTLNQRLCKCSPKVCMFNKIPGWLFKVFNVISIKTSASFTAIQCAEFSQSEFTLVTSFLNRRQHLSITLWVTLLMSPPRILINHIPTTLN